MQRMWPKLFPSKHGSPGGQQTQTPRSGSRTMGTDSPRVVGYGQLADNREISGGMSAGHRGPGGPTLEDEEDNEDLEMQSPSRRKEATDRKEVIEGVVPVRMNGW